MSYVSYDFDRHPMPRSVVARIRERLAGKSGDAAAWKADTLGQQQGSIGVEGQRSKTASAVSALERGEPGMSRVQVPTAKAAQGSAPCCNGTTAGLAPGPHLRCSRDKE